MSDDVRGNGDAAAVETDAARERDEIYDRLLRLTAEYENYRKRTERERRELWDTATADVLRDVLPVVDDLERALAAPGWTDPASHRGVELIHRQLVETLRRRGVEPLETVGQNFDPAWHEAVASEPAGGHRDGEITAELRRGYKLGSKLVRAAQVKVARA
jgi:molecular chaperone GrpE